MIREFKKSTLREYFESIVIAVILALFIRTFVVQAFKIPTGSMEENLLIGDHLLVNKFVFGPTETAAERKLLPVGDIKRRNIIVFKYPEEPDRDFIKRVIGLPGDMVSVRNNHAYINGKVLNEPYINKGTLCDNLCNLPKPIKVPPGHFFMMGDNRGESDDSRDWGPVPKKWIIGHAFFTYWPPSRIGTL
jgi:signal peptidase I